MPKQVKERKLTKAEYNSLIKAGYQLEPYKDLCNKNRDDYEEMLRTAKLTTKPKSGWSRQDVTDWPQAKRVEEAMLRCAQTQSAR